MRGKIKADNKYKKLREVMLQDFKSYNRTTSSVFYNFFNLTDSINNIIFNCCDEGENFDWDKNTHAHVLYFILRLVKEYVLWRDLERLSERIWTMAYCGDKVYGRRALVESFAILYSLNLVDYIVEPSGICQSPGDRLKVFIKEDDDWK